MLNEICWTRFDPEIDNSNQIPDKRGVYIIGAKNISDLPKSMVGLTYSLLESSPIIYVGISGRKTSKVFGLRDRDYKTHFNGTARRSTLRKSLGVLWNYEKVQYANEINTTKYRFTHDDEDKLSEWMKNSLILYYMTSDNPEEIEVQLIDYYAPPLNLKDNKRVENHEFRKTLSKLRCTL